jgi:plastocyanin
MAADAWRVKRLFAAGVFAATLPTTVSAGTVRGTVHAPGLRSPEGVVIFIDRIPGAAFAPPETRPIVDQKKLTFIPPVLPVLVGTTVEFHNGEEPSEGRGIKHNIFSPSPAARFDLGTYGYGRSKSVTFDKPGIVTLLCNVHPEMSAYVVVVETPFFAVTDRAGSYRIEGVPQGRFLLKTWHPRLPSGSREVRLSDEVVVDFSLRR